MKRHIGLKHKTPGEKREHDEGTDDTFSEREDKRPKIDEHFEPDLASTQISEDDDDELDEFEEVLKAEENDYNEDGLSFHMSDDTVARLGNETHFDFQNIEMEEEENAESEGKQEVVQSVLQADLALMKVKINSLENVSKAKDLKVVELETKNGQQVLEISSCVIEINRLETDNKLKDELYQGS